MTGWHVAAAFELVRGESPVVLGRLLAELAERIDVRILVWAGAPVPAFHPTRSEVEEAVRNLVRDTRIRCETDPREHPFHCHHEKTIVIDGEAGLCRGDRSDQRRRRPLRLLGARGPPPAGLARRRDAARRTGGRRRRSPLRAALACADRRADRACAGAGAGRRAHRAGDPHGGRGHVRPGAQGRLQHPRELHPGAALRPAADLHREPVPVGAGAGRDPRRRSCASRPTRTSAW